MCELNRAEYAVRLSDVMYRYLTAYLWALPAELHLPSAFSKFGRLERLPSPERGPSLPPSSNPCPSSARLRRR